MNETPGSNSWSARRARRFLARALACALALTLTQAVSSQQDADAPVNARAGGEGVSFGNFSEPIELVSLIDFLSRTLDINIVLSDADLAGRFVEFRAPVTIARDDLIPMLETFLAQHGFGLTETDEGIIMVASAERLPVRLEGDLATTRVFPTTLVKPSSLSTPINNLLGEGQKPGNIVYSDELGVIISTAPPHINRSLESIISLLLSEQAAIGFYRFDLTHVAAEEAVQRILEFAGQSRGQQGAGRQTPGQPAAAAQAGGGIIGGALANLADRMVIDRQSNGIIFRGSEAEADELRSLIAIVDSPSRLVIRRYNAGAMSSVIAQYGERLGLGPVSVGATTTASFIGSGFTVEDDQAGAFTYYGTPEQHDRVTALVEEFAEQVRNEEMIVEFYRLEHADAEQAADLLSQLLELGTDEEVGESPFVTRSLESTGPRGVGAAPTTQRGIARVEPQTPDLDPGALAAAGVEQARQDLAGPAGEGDETSLTPAEGLAIIADIARNQLMVRAPRRQQREIAQIIEDIDQRRPQMYLEATIVAIERSKGFQITVETVISDPDSDYPVFTNFGLLTDPKDVDGVRSPFADGLSAAIINNDYVPILLTALANEGDSDVLSSPRLLVNDNEAATLTSTDNEPFASTSQTVGTPSQTSLGGQVSAGTTLSVTPHISNGGYVQLEVSIELSSFGDRFDPDLPPPTTSNTVDSYITVPADSTVVIGGLKQSQTTNTVQKIPLLGDIPGLGFLFRSTSKTKSERTLFIFLTPKIIRDPGFADLRLLTKGPAAEFEVDIDETPALEPAFMEIFPSRGPSQAARLERAAIASREENE